MFKREKLKDFEPFGNWLGHGTICFRFVVIDTPKLSK